MSRGQLRALHEAHAFDPAPLRSSLGELHVPFDELYRTSRYENRLFEAVRTGHRVALVGASGCGKSSMMQSVLGPLVEGVAPILLPISVERSGVATEAGEFLEHLIATVRHWVHEGLPASGAKVDRVTEPRKRATTGRRLGVAPGWMGASVELSYELRQVTEEPPRSTAEVLPAATRVLEVIRDADLLPVLVLDDTDRWILPGGGNAGVDRRIGFFGQVVRVIAEDLAVAAVVAVHPSYVDDPHYQAARGFLDETIQVPDLPDAQAVGLILSRRADLALGGGDLVPEQVMTSGALGALYGYYDAAPNVRSRVLAVVNQALTLALDDDDDAIAAGHVEAAIAEFTNGSVGG